MSEWKTDGANVWLEIERAVVQEAARLGLGGAAETMARRQEKLELIRLLRDQTHSKEIYDRCVAIVGRE